MNKKNLLFPSLAIGAVLGLARKAFAKTGLAKPVTHGPAYDAIDACIEGQMRRLKVPGVSLAIIEGDQIVRLRGFGYGDGRSRSGGEVPTPQTSFSIGSPTKSFTALAVMQLVEAGRVELDAPVQRYLPWFRVADPQASAQMTVRHLLNQTSGLPESSAERALADFDDRPDATERQARGLASVKLTHPVGSACEYCDMNYNLLGLIIEAASGKSYADYIKEYIFAPLDMNLTGHSQTGRPGDGPPIPVRHSLPHARFADSPRFASVGPARLYCGGHSPLPDRPHERGALWRGPDFLSRWHQRTAPGSSRIPQNGCLGGQIWHGLVRRLSLLWCVLRTGLVLRALRNGQVSKYSTLPREDAIP
jgi:CubicO group peptidase (beta-lactamase class C family)